VPHPDVEQFVLDALPPAPVRVLEVGAGDGELAGRLRAAGYEVVAIDPSSDALGVRPVALDELDEPAASFDAAVAVVALHHVEPLEDSCRRLGELVRPRGPLVLDEFDVERWNEDVAQWWLDHREEHDDDEEERTPADILEFLRHHCHPLGALRAALEPWFELGDAERGPYLYRWNLPADMRATEEALIATGELPAIGARFVGIRR
jgi:SAM-dependent methyltransferase